MRKPTRARKPLISVVLSFFNEENVIPELIRRLRKAFEGTDCDHELVFVNDASTDRSYQILVEAAGEQDDIRILTTSRNFGHMPCIYAGVEAAQGDAVIYMDADLQDPPELIPEMIRAWKSEDDIDVVYTTRTHRDGEGFFKLLITNLGYRILKYTSNINIALNSGDFRLLSRRAVDEFLKFKEKKPFFRFLVSWIGFKQKQVFYRREARYDGKTKFPFGTKVITQFLEISLVPFSDLPLRFSLLLGFLTSFCSFLYLIGVVVMKACDMNLPGWSAIMAGMLFLGGVQLVVTGMQGLYVGAIYNEVRGRPNFIIRDWFGFEAAPGQRAAANA